MAKALKLIAETPQYDIHDYNILVEQKNSSDEKHYYIEGPFTEANRRNRNQRIYPLEEMVQQINEYNETYVTKNRALGELEHPPYPQVNIAEACHMITSLRQDGNVFIGKSKILDTPKGQTVQKLLAAGVNLGISSRALGEVNENGVVTDFKLCTFDIVHDPSCQIAFVNGILEAKEWICNGDEKYEEVYEGFEKALAKLPKHDLENYLYEQVSAFLKKLH